MQRVIAAIGYFAAVRSALSPIEFYKLFCDGADRQVKFAAIISPVLDRETGNADQQGIFIGGAKLSLGQKPLDLAQEGYLFFRRRTGDQDHLIGPRTAVGLPSVPIIYFALAGIT